MNKDTHMEPVSEQIREPEYAEFYTRPKCHGNRKQVVNYDYAGNRTVRCMDCGTEYEDIVK